MNNLIAAPDAVATLLDHTAEHRAPPSKAPTAAPSEFVSPAPTAAPTHAEKGWQEFIAHDCNNVLHFMPGTPLEMNLNGKFLEELLARRRRKHFAAAARDPLFFLKTRAALPQLWPGIDAHCRKKCCYAVSPK